MGRHETTAELERQAVAFGTYLIGERPVKAVVSLYVHAMHRSPAVAPRDRKLLAFALAHPWFIGCVDAGLVFTDPHSEVRRRLYVLFAILEALPEYSDHFLPRQRSPFYVLLLGFVGLRAVGRALIGLVLVKALR